MGKRKEIEKRAQLLVEGNDQRNFFEHFCQHLSLDGIQIHDFGGVNDLSKFLASFIQSPRFALVTRLGIVRDAEKDALSAFQSVKSALENNDLPSPEKPCKFLSDRPGPGVLILPGDNAEGMLETLLCRTIAEEPEYICIDEFFRCIKKRTGNSIKRPDKSLAFSFLSTREHPELSVGVAAKKGYWNLDHAALNHVRDFLKQLTTPI